MSRNFLFAASVDDATLTHFIERAGKVSGFLKGAPGGHLNGWHRVGANNLDFLQQLNARITETFPTAGQPFYAVRLWTNLMWQPAYLAVIGAHVIGTVPDLSTLSQARQNVDVNGYRLEPKPQFTGTLEQRIAHAGAQLRDMGQEVLAEINTLTKLKRVPALRLLTDRMLGLMTRLKDYCPDLTLEDQYRYCDLWLEAMGLVGHGGLETLELHDGIKVAIVARKGCCLDYLAMPNTYCMSCPKQDDAVRMQRQRDNAIAELEMQA